MKKRFGSFSSSANPDRLSLSIQGVGMAIIPFVIIAGRFFGFSFLETDLSELVQSISLAASAVMIAYGLIRKFIVSLSVKQ